MLGERTKHLRDASVLDAGASDGLFLNEELGVRRGVALNLLWECSTKARHDGAVAVQGNVERLPFGDNSFDYVLCCETLEHVSNPVATLDELARVCRKRIYLTIPWLQRTWINPRPDGWPQQEGHIFEFSENDFGKLVTHSPVKIVHQDRVRLPPAQESTARVLAPRGYLPVRLS